MRCQTKFNEAVNSRLSPSLFDPTKYRQDIKNDIFVSLHKPEVTAVVGEIENQKYRLNSIQNIAEVKLNNINRYLPIHPQMDWTSHPEVREYFVNVGLK